jgi:glycosyltransferase involved in cell wall biosynthesis
MKSSILIIDPKSHIRRNPSVFGRHESYADELENRTNGGKKLAILSFGFAGEIEVLQKNNLTVIHFPILSLLIKKRLLEFIQKRGLIEDVELMIAGDPWLSAFFCLLLKRTYFKRAKLQFQVHADLGSIVWQRMSARNRLKVQLAKISLRRADQIRCVSKSQASQVSDFFDIKPERVVIVPVASVLKKATPKIKVLKEQQISIGFVGRIQNDRGLASFVEIVKKLNSQRQDFNIIIAGSGPERKNFLKSLSLFMNDSRIIDFGEVLPTEMDKVWRKIGVLLSCPQAESFGRALRESIAEGVPIWVTSTTGALDFVENLDSEIFRIVSSDLGPSEIEQQFSALLRAKVPETYANHLSHRNNDYVKDLIRSWLEIGLAS